MSTLIFDNLLTLLERPAMLQRAVSLEEWYTRTRHCPPMGRSNRGTVRAELEVQAHQAFINPEISDTIDALLGSDELTSLTLSQAGFVRRLRFSLDRKRLLPDSFVRQHSETCNAANDVWAAARESRDFSALPAALTQVFESTRAKAEFFGADMTNGFSIYDALLQDFEPGFTTERLLDVLVVLKNELVPLRSSILARTKDHYPETFRQWGMTEEDSAKICRRVVDRLGFDFARGGLSFAAHPFCISLGPDDVQLTMRHVPGVPLAQFFGAVHEAGHGMYDQHVPRFISEHLPPGYIFSLGVHESQSRMFENTVCRSPEMLEFLEQEFSGYLPPGNTLEGLTRYANYPHPTTIRVESSEMDYNLHVMIRVEVELAVLNGELRLEEVPEYFNRRMQDLLGVHPTDNYSGAWQDVHWPTGTIGYFGTYTLGNVASAQLFSTFAEHSPQWRDQLRTGELQPLRSWLDRNVWQTGYTNSLDDVLISATGEPLNAKYWLTYIGDKYNALYA